MTLLSYIYILDSMTIINVCTVWATHYPINSATYHPIDMEIHYPLTWQYTNQLTGQHTPLRETHTIVQNVVVSQKVMVVRFTSNPHQSDIRQHSTNIGKVHLPFSYQPSHFPPQPSSSMSSLASISSFDHQPQNPMPISRL